MIFRDRDDAGVQLAGQLARETFDDPIVLALPRGGVPVAVRVAAALTAPLEVFIARKVGAPGQPEVRGRDVILVDDGLATGVTAEAALRAIRGRGPHRLVLAVPVCPPDTAHRLATVADDVICVESPAGLDAVGAWYDDFAQTTDDEVLDLLASARDHTAATSPADPEITVAIPGGELHADLAVPDSPCGVVLFAHGSGSGRHSPRNRGVAAELQRRGMATMLMDLLTDAEEREDAVTAGFRFDIHLLAERLVGATEWLEREPSTAHLPIGYFGASTGAAAALVAAAHRGGRLAAIVSRGGRPDLAGDALFDVRAPTLLIVGGLDRTVVELNELALERLSGTHELRIVPGATHLFEEPGTLDQVARLAGGWFTRHLGPTPHTEPMER